MPIKDPEARRAYQRTYQRTWYENNKDLQKERVSRSNKANRAAVNEYLESLKSKTPCTDCGVLYPPECMDFDHLTDKAFDIGKRGNKALPAVLKEIDKCEIVCANCHRTRTKRRRTAGVVE